jgi:hypothetical protein
MTLRSTTDAAKKEPIVIQDSPVRKDRASNVPRPKTTTVTRASNNGGGGGDEVQAAPASNRASASTAPSARRRPREVIELD